MVKGSRKDKPVWRRNHPSWIKAPQKINGYMRRVIFYGNSRQDVYDANRSCSEKAHYYVNGVPLCGGRAEMFIKAMEPIDIDDFPEKKVCEACRLAHIMSKNLAA